MKVLGLIVLMVLSITCSVEAQREIVLIDSEGERHRHELGADSGLVILRSDGSPEVIAGYKNGELDIISTIRPDDQTTIRYEGDVLVRVNSNGPSWRLETDYLKGVLDFISVIDRDSGEYGVGVSTRDGRAFCVQ